MKKSLCHVLLATFAVLTPFVATDSAEAAKKKVVFLSGKPSHAPGDHEHYAGCLLLANRLRVAMPEYDVHVYKYDWPEDAAAFDGADTVVIYCDGGGRHMSIPHLEFKDKLMKKGVGLVCIHYAVEVPKGDVGDRFVDWLGGYFEPNWSVNPHWDAHFKKLPDHPVTRGVKPFTINDEWYFHMRFREKMEGVTPILTAVAPESTMSRPDGAHSGNKDVREAVAKGIPQHVAWATERKDGGRAFGFTGGHFHRNWGHDDFRKVVLNAIVWTAKGEVPARGVTTKAPNKDELQENLDPKGRRRKKPAQKKNAKLDTTKARFSSKRVTPGTSGHAVDVDADIRGAKKLFLVVNDGGDGLSCDWADWIEPRLVGPQGEKKLTDLKWVSAETSYGQVRVGRNAGGNELRVDGRAVKYGIGTHANSVIAYDLPAGYERFKAKGGLDEGGTGQGCGSTVQFQVYVDVLPALVARGGGSAAAGVSREPEKALEGLEVADGLEAALFASEPTLLSPTNIDIDDRGRVWVCEVVNYRRRNGERKEGDRILILEDTDGDGKSDTKKVFYQNNDINSVHGVCVLGDKVIVSALDKVWILTDSDGDDKPDKKEVLFSGIAGSQHDHGIHAVMFGPDGKLYFNFGNNGREIKDKDGNPIIDVAGNVVSASRDPYQEGMVFRCNLDGSEFETLGWNFRNNWMITTDSFGTLWQSDNDDDGNQGVRINFVMEFGNYGYKDEFTGAGWRDKRTGWHDEIPLRHWHLNDPGVVPNLLQTGAGSPTGICVYEGDLLPKVFHNQMIHCDAGPNVVRAYPVKNDGAGYSAETVNILTGVRDKWFRPSDVTVAPDGSLIVADWYDPGVGGHAMGDAERGRLFRIAPPGVKYKVPKFDYSTPETAVEALKSPTLSVRYLAWTALHKMGERAEPALQKLYADKNPRFRARALWLLAKIDGRGPHYVEEALADADSDIRIVGIRLARQLKLNVIPIVEKLTRDKSPQVRRECLIALRHHKSPEAPGLWAELAAQHDGKDRWYLEALGIAADKQWDACLGAWFDKVGDNWNTASGRDVIWRSRATQTPKLLAEMINTASVPTEELPRYLRAFDFQKADGLQETLAALAFDGNVGDRRRQGIVAAEAVSRLNGFDISSDPKRKAAMNRILDDSRGTSQFVTLTEKFSVAERYPELLALARAKPSEQVGVEAIRALLVKQQRKLISEALRAKDLEVAVATAGVLGNSADGRAPGLLLPIVRDETFVLDLRRAATVAVGKSKSGADELIKQFKAGKLDERLKDAAASSLHASTNRKIKAQALELFPLPPTKNNEPLPSIEDLVKRRGNTKVGQKLFADAGTCAKCHIVNGQGKEVGPDLSDIGNKLSREAFFQSILFPSAGISHNYESYILQTADGEVVTGLLVSDTDEAVSLKSPDSIVRTFKKDDLDGFKMQEISLMPADLQKLLTAQDLVDVVAYLETLKKAKK